MSQLQALGSEKMPVKYDRVRDCCWRGERCKFDGEYIVPCHKIQAGKHEYRCAFHGNKKSEICPHFLLIMGVPAKEKV